MDLIANRLEVNKIDFESVLREHIQESSPAQEPSVLPANPILAPAEEVKIIADAYEAETEEPEEAAAPFTAVSKKRPYCPIKYMQSFFAARIPYALTLFNVRKNFQSTPETTAAQERWKNCSEIKEGYQIKMLFALLAATEQKSHQNLIAFSDDRSCILKCTLTGVDSSLLDRLDVHHLFTRQVDSLLFSCGIAEKIRDLIQVSIAGTISINGKTKVGFFQYTFIPSDWKCIHRCFKEYNQNLDESYISRPLRKALCEFLKEHMADNGEYTAIINDLERLTK